MIARLGAGVVLLALLPTMAAAQQEVPPPGLALIEEGEHVFLRRCSRCHGRAADEDPGGNIRGKSINEIHVAVDGFDQMPPQRLREGDAEAIAAFLAHLAAEDG